MMCTIQKQLVMYNPYSIQYYSSPDFSVFLNSIVVVVLRHSNVRDTDELQGRFNEVSLFPQYFITAMFTGAVHVARFMLCFISLLKNINEIMK
jgi:glutaredoxin-related protein